MADISVLVDKITSVVVEIIFKEDVITSSVAMVTYIMVEITFKVAVVTSTETKITFVVNETTFSGSDYFFSSKYNLCSDRDHFICWLTSVS